MRSAFGFVLLFVHLAVIAQTSDVARSQQGNESPLPPMHDLLLELDRNEKAVEASARDYTYKVHIAEQNFDGSGAVKKTSSSDAESLTIDGVRVNRVTARDGKALSPDEIRKENERIDKEVAKARERRAKHNNNGEDTDSRGDAIIPISRILELGTFTNPRRETVRGRSTIVMDYAGNPGAKTHGPAEGIIRDLVGTVWIDESDRVLVRGEGHFLNDFKIGGGLVMNIHKGFRFDFESAKVNGEAWLPAAFNGQGSARILLFKGVNGSLQATISDYRKFRTEVKIQPASHVLDENGNPVPDQTLQTPQQQTAPPQESSHP